MATISDGRAPSKPGDPHARPDQCGPPPEQFADNASPRADGWWDGRVTGKRVFLLDDHEVVREGIRAVLDAEPDLEVVGEWDVARGAVDAILEAQPDVAVFDVRLPDGSGIDVLREVRQKDPEIKGLVLTGFQDDDALFAAVVAGAAGLRPEAGRDRHPGQLGAARGQRPLDDRPRRRAAPHRAPAARARRGPRARRAHPHRAPGARARRPGDDQPPDRRRSSPWPRRRSRTTSPASWPSCASPVVRRPRCWRPSSASRRRGAARVRGDREDDRASSAGLGPWGPKS